MRRQTAIALGVAVLLGLIAVYLANIFLSSNQQQAEQAQVGTVKVAVASVPLDYGVEVTPEKLRFADFPANSVPPGSFQNMQQLLPAGQRRVALRSMVIGEPILTGKISGPGQGASLAALLPDGMRAASVQIDPVSGVSGFVQPNDTVDVLITRTLTGNGGNTARQVTDVLLQAVRIIAIDQDAKGQDGQPALGKTATLEVNPIDAQKLALAQSAGRLSLVLRKPGAQDDNAAIQTVSIEDLRYGRAGSAVYRPSSAPAQVVRSTVRRPVSRPVPRPTVAREPSTSSIDVVRGTKSDNYEVGRYGS